MAAVSGANSGGGGSSAIRAGSAYVELFLDDNKFWRSIEGLKRRLTSAGAMLTKAGLGAIGMGVGVGAPIAGALKTTLDHITEIGSLAVKLGVPIEKLSELTYAAETAGMRVEDMAGHFENFQERVHQAILGGGEGLQAFKMLGIDPKALSQMDAVEQIILTIERLNQQPNRTVALGIASSLGGDKFQELLKIKDLRSAMREASTVGAVYTTEQLEQTKEINRAWLQVKTSIRSVLIEVGAALLGESGTIKDYAQAIVGVTREIAKWVRENRQLIIVAVGVAGALVGIGTALVTLGFLIQGVAMGLGGLRSGVRLLVGGLGLLLSPLGMFTAGMVLMLTQTDSGSKLLGKFGEAAKNAGSTFTSMWGGVIAAVKSGDLQLAFKIATAGVKTIWYGMLIDMGAAFADFVEENRTRIVALAALSGARTGASLMRVGGPWATALGALALGAGSAITADQALDDLKKMGLNPQLMSLRNAAKKEMEDLTAQARAAQAGAAAKPDAGRMSTDYLGGGEPFGKAVKAMGAFQSQDFSRLFSAGSVADKQFAAVQVIKKQAIDAARALEELQTIAAGAKTILSEISQGLRFGP